MNLNLDYQIVKCKHFMEKWFYIYKMTNDLWCVVVYADDEEDIIFSTLAFSEVSAIHIFNKLKDEETLNDIRT